MAPDNLAVYGHGGQGTTAWWRDCYHSSRRHSYYTSYSMVDRPAVQGRNRLAGRVARPRAWTRYYIDCGRSWTGLVGRLSCRPRCHVTFGVCGAIRSIDRRDPNALCNTMQNGARRYVAPTRKGYTRRSCGATWLRIGTGVQPGIQAHDRSIATLDSSKSLGPAGSIETHPLLRAQIQVRSLR